jgi:hypothetical protein
MSAFWHKADIDWRLGRPLMPSFIYDLLDHALGRRRAVPSKCQTTVSLPRDEQLQFQVIVEDLVGDLIERHRL